MNPHSQSFGATQNPHSSTVGFWPVNKFPPISKMNASGTIVLAAVVGYGLHALLADDAASAMSRIRWANMKDHIIWGVLPAAVLVALANGGVYLWQN